MDNEKEQAVENVKRKPLSDGELHEILTEIKRKAKREDHLYIVKADLIYGLTKEDVEVYAYLNTKNKKVLEYLSKILRKKDGRPLAEFFAANSYSMEQMEIIEKFYFMGITLDDISEVLKEEQTAFSLDHALQNVYERLFVSTEKSRDESYEVQQKQEQILEAVSKIGSDYELLNSIKEAVEKSLTKEDVDAIRQEYVEKIESLEAAIEDLRKSNESLSRDNAVLRQSKADVSVITDENAELKVQINTLKKERDAALAKAEDFRKENEGMERQVGNLREEMDAVKAQVEKAKANPSKEYKAEAEKRAAVQSDTFRNASKRSDYQVVVDKKPVCMEYTNSKSPEGIIAKAGRILKGLGKPNVLHTMADAGLNSEQMAMLGQAKQKGLTDAELIDIISCGFDIEEMAQAIDIVLMEKSY